MTSASRICQRLGDESVAGDLASGDRIAIYMLAAGYEVSQMPVREALRELQGKALIFVQTTRGTWERNMGCGMSARRADSPCTWPRSRRRCT